MRKNTAEVVANEMAAQGYKPILAHATRDTGLKTWEVWGTDPNTLAAVMVATREEWDQYVADKAHTNAVDYCADREEERAPVPQTGEVVTAFDAACFYNGHGEPD